MNLKIFAEKKLIPGVLIVLAALYLTFIVDVYTLNTALERAYVFLYFAVMGWFLRWVKSKYLGKTKWKIMLTAAFLAALLLAVLQSTFLPTTQEYQITLRANRAENMPIGEVWLVGIELDGEYCEASALKNAIMEGWTYNADYEDYVYIPTEENVSNSLTFEVNAEELSLCFASNPWAGSVEVEQQGSAETVILYTEAQQDKSLSYLARKTQKYRIWERAALNAGAWIVISFLLSCALSEITDRKRISDSNAEEKDI